MKNMADSWMQMLAHEAERMAEAPWNQFHTLYDHGRHPRHWMRELAEYRTSLLGQKAGRPFAPSATEVLLHWQRLLQRLRLQAFHDHGRLEDQPPSPLFPALGRW
jgi:hypothetical protein